MKDVSGWFLSLYDQEELWFIPRLIVLTIIHRAHSSFSSSSSLSSIHPSNRWRSETSLRPSLSICRLVCWSICHILLKGRDVSLPCSYRSNHYGSNCYILHTCKYESNHHNTKSLAQNKVSNITTTRKWPVPGELCHILHCADEFAMNIYLCKKETGVGVWSANCPIVAKIKIALRHDNWELVDGKKIVARKRSRSLFTSKY